MDAFLIVNRMDLYFCSYIFLLETVDAFLVVNRVDLKSLEFNDISLKKNVIR